MALDRIEVRINIPQDLDVVLQVLADEAGDSKVGIAKDIICAVLEKHLKRHQKLHSGLKELGLQSQVEDRRGFSEKQRDNGQ